MGNSSRRGGKFWVRSAFCNDTTSCCCKGIPPLSRCVLNLGAWQTRGEIAMTSGTEFLSHPIEAALVNCSTLSALRRLRLCPRPAGDGGVECSFGVPRIYHPCNT